MAKVHLDIRSINQGLRRALGDAANELESLYFDAFDQVSYVWPNKTFRRNQTVVGSPRDKVDLGNLQASTSYRISDLNVTFEWDPKDPVTGKPYAAIVFFGYTESSGRVLPGSNWITVAHNIRSPEEVIGGACRAIFN
jgi:hypothetical protein